MIGALVYLSTLASDTQFVGFKAYADTIAILADSVADLCTLAFLTAEGDRPADRLEYCVIKQKELGERIGATQPVRELAAVHAALVESLGSIASSLTTYADDRNSIPAHRAVLAAYHSYQMWRKDTRKFLRAHGVRLMTCRYKEGERWKRAGRGITECPNVRIACGCRDP